MQAVKVVIKHFSFFSNIYCYKLPGGASCKNTTIIYRLKSLKSMLALPIRKKYYLIAPIFHPRQGLI